MKLKNQWKFVISPSGIAFLAAVGCMVAYLFQQEGGHVATGLGYSVLVLLLASLSLYAEGEQS